MILYLDTSVIVTALTQEAETRRTIDWLEAQAVERLAISRWVTTEFSAALSIKVRAGRLSLNERAACLAKYGGSIARSFAMLPVMEAHFTAAARLADQAALGLRAGDALHLAIASGSGATVVTRDRRMAEAAIAAGMGSVLV